jgi:hypothetical protein
MLKLAITHHSCHLPLIPIHIVPNRSYTLSQAPTFQFHPLKSNKERQSPTKQDHKKSTPKMQVPPAKS